MTVNAHRMGPGTLKFGETGSPQEFSSQLTAAKLTPTIEEEDNIPVLSGEELEGEDTETWVLSGTFLQDYSGLASLIVWCKTQSGLPLSFTFTPSSAGGLSVSGVVKIRPVEIGGDVKARNTTDFEFKGVGDYTYAVAGA